MAGIKVYIIGLVLGVFIMYLIDRFIMPRCGKHDGILHIDTSNPEKDLYRFDIDDLDKLHKKNYMVIKINKNADLTQK